LCYDVCLGALHGKCLNNNDEVCLLQMNSSATSPASTEPWTADKRHKTGDVKRKMSKKICGAYNHTGCKVADECRFVHKYDLRTGANYYINILPKAKEQKGLILDSKYPREFKDLRMRNRESMTNTELTELSKMPPLGSRVKPTTAKVADSRKKVGPKVSTHVESEAAKQVGTDMKSELAQPVGTDMKSELEQPVGTDMKSEPAQPVGIDAKSEPAKPKLTREEREANIRAERKEYVDEQMLKAFHKASTGDWTGLDAERKTIHWEADIDMNIKLVALELEYQQCTEVCYMQQEMQEGKDDQDDRVYNHRFQLLTPGTLGVFNPSGPCNQSNVGDLALLLRNLNEFMVDEGDDSYVCRFCFRSLYPRKTRRERILCACLRCVSVLYCSPWCRDEDAQGHRFSCFLHPAWECEEGTKRRVEEMHATGMRAQQLVEHKVPAIETVLDPKGDSRVKPDPAAHLIAEQHAAQLIAEQLAAAPQQDDAAQQQGVDDEDDINVVGDSDEDAKAAAKDTAKTDAEDTATAKTAVTSGDTDVDTTE
jgi:hypothetical protein